MNEPLFNIDLNQLPNDQEGVIELDEYPKEIGGSMHCHEYIELNEFGKKKDDLVENEIEPFIGRCFLSEEEAFICYKKYACANVFSIKKYRTDKKKGEVKRRDYCCQYEGKAPLKLFDPSKEQRNRISVKCGCKARMRITLRKSCDIFPQEWQVTQFVREHNHELLTPLEVQFLPANRIIIKEDEDRILLLKEGGLSVKQIMRIMELEKGIDHGYLPFCEKDVRNLFTRVRKEHGTHDAADLLQHCKIAKEENVKFQYAFTVDLAIENIQQRQLHNTMLQKYRGSALRTMSPLEKQACGVLTPFCFEKFQEEFGRATLYSLVHESGCEFVVKYHENTMSKTHKVFWDGETTTCSCKHFEFWGILCRHILSVFLHKDCYKIPYIYLPSRWCREQPESEEVAQSVEGSPRLDGEILVDKAINDIQCPPISITKGRPKTKRLKGGKEAGKVTRSRGWCRKVGHNITTCPDKENVEHGIASQRKKKKISSSDMGLNHVFSLKY
ncbi:hypothetical protein Vadar_005885 [Vaccinium darrowii]|uniref:Uncharacterized protein n=1 Tax=Vaccinium darrowii TaxID=229202 RepID=A0ACB7Y6I4_9ERIC|nr:hypothetical protein Vadar_005885 [Vaccinium darrowii]